MTEYKYKHGVKVLWKGEPRREERREITKRAKQSDTKGTKIDRK